MSINLTGKLVRDGYPKFLTSRGHRVRARALEEDEEFRGKVLDLFREYTREYAVTQDPHLLPELAELLRALADSHPGYSPGVLEAEREGKVWELGTYAGRLQLLSEDFGLKPSGSSA